MSVTGCFVGKSEKQRRNGHDRFHRGRQILILPRLRPSTESHLQNAENSNRSMEFPLHLDLSSLHQCV